MDSELNILLNPEVCGSLGVDCMSCAQRAAQDIAALCANLAGRRLESAFFRMYPQPACSGMLPEFVQKYYDATEPDLKSLLRLSQAVAA